MSTMRSYLFPIFFLACFLSSVMAAAPSLALVHSYALDSSAVDTIGGTNYEGVSTSVTYSAGGAKFAGSGVGTAAGHIAFPAGFAKSFIAAFATVTIELWVVPSSSQNGDCTLLGLASTAGSITNSISITRDSATSKLAVVFNDGTTTTTGVSTANFYVSGGYQVTVVLSTSAPLLVYVNGVVVLTGETTTTLGPTVGTIVYLGTSATSTSGTAFAGQVTQFNIYNGAKTAAQVLSTYSAGENTVFSSPTAPTMKSAGSTSQKSSPLNQPPNHLLSHRDKHLLVQSEPTSHPTAQPSSQPSRQPSSQPSRQPSGQPSGVPTRQPTTFPTTPLQTTVSFNVTHELREVDATLFDTTQPECVAALRAALAMLLNVPVQEGVTYRGYHTYANRVYDASYEQTTRRLGETHGSRGIAVSYTINVVPTAIGFTDSSAAVQSLKADLRKSVTRGTFVSVVRNQGQGLGCPALAQTEGSTLTYMSSDYLSVVTHSAYPTSNPTIIPRVGRPLNRTGVIAGTIVGVGAFIVAAIAAALFKSQLSVMFGMSPAPEALVDANNNNNNNL